VFEPPERQEMQIGLREVRLLYELRGLLLKWPEMSGHYGANDAEVIVR